MLQHRQPGSTLEPTVWVSPTFSWLAFKGIGTSLRLGRGGLFDGPLPESEVVISTLPTGAADPLAAMPWRR